MWHVEAYPHLDEGPSNAMALPNHLGPASRTVNGTVRRLVPMGP